MPEENVAQEPVQPVQEPVAALQQVNLESRLSELESFLSERDKEISELKKVLEDSKASALQSQGAVQEGAKAIQEKEAALADRDKALASVLTAYRTAILQAHPDIPEELVTGNTLEELQVSLDKAKGLVQKIRSQAAVVPAPAGAPARGAPDFSAMSPREKIVQGLRK